jgi:hypothetical protein
MSRRLGSNSAVLTARTVTRPHPGTETDRATSTTTVRGSQLRSTGHRQRRSRAPFASAKRRASAAGPARAPNASNVTGAAARAAASAAAAAWSWAR